jgi:hypothetical protein
MLASVLVADLRVSINLKGGNVAGRGFIVQGPAQCELQMAADTAALPMPVTWFSTLALAFSFPLIGT